MLTKLKRWWGDLKRTRRDAQDRAEFAKLHEHCARGLECSDFSEWVRMKYTYCMGCSCPELYHNTNHAFSWCEICNCKEYMMPPIDCRNVWVAPVDERCGNSPDWGRGTTEDLFPSEEGDLH